MSETFFSVPEVPTDTADTNLFMKPGYLPLTQNVSPKEVLNGMLKFTSDFQFKFDEFVDKFQSILIAYVRHTS